MSLFHDRSKSTRADPHLEWKVRFFSVAAVLGVAGFYFDERWMGFVAIGLLGSAFLLRFLPPGGSEEVDDDAEDRTD